MNLDFPFQPRDQKRYDEILVIAKEEGRPQFGNSNLKRYLRNRDELRGNLFGLPDEALEYAFRRWIAKLPDMRDPEKTVQILTDWGEEYQHRQENSPRPHEPLRPDERGCEHCEEGWTSHEVLHPNYIFEVTALAACPRCNQPMVDYANAYNRKFERDHGA